MRKQPPRLRAVTEGYARLSQLFDSAVRARATSYVESCVELVADTERCLAARVRGTEEYRAAFVRSGEALRYACSCPFFSDGEQACKHLWALVLCAPESALVVNAASARRWGPAQVPWVTSGTGDVSELLAEAELEVSAAVTQSEDRSLVELLEATIERYAALGEGEGTGQRSEGQRD